MKAQPILTLGHAGPGDKPDGLTPATLDSDPIRVLIVEDEDAHFQLMKRAICKELPETSVCHASDAAECIDALDSINPDIILVDFLMPGMTGIEFLDNLKQMGCDIPVIMITGQGDERIAVQAMKLGAQDYLVKSADFFLLLPAVIGQAARERRLKVNLRKVARLNELLLDSLPYPAMMIRRDRMVMAANQIAQRMGARVGTHCWRRFKLGGNVEVNEESPRECHFCRVDEAFAHGEAIETPEIALHGRFWDKWWIPIDHEVCLTYAIDITERKQAELKRYHKNKLIEGINRIFEQALSGATETTLGEVCIAAAQEATGSRIGFIGEVSADGVFHDIAISRTGREACRMIDKEGHGALPLDFQKRCIYGYAIEEGKAFFINDITDRVAQVPLPAGHPSISSFLGMPFFRQGRLVGMIALANREGGYSAVEQEMLESLAPTIWETLLRKRAESERQRIAEDRHRNEERFRKAFENAPTGIALIDLEERFIRCNQAFCHLLGYTEKELRRIAVSDILHPEDRETNLLEIDRLRAEKHPFFEVENRYVHKDGHPIWVHKFVSLLPDPAGGPAQMMALVSDITKSKQDQEMLSDLNKALVERTKLAEQRAGYIQQLAMELSKAEESERQRLAGVLHDDFQQMLAYLKLKLSMLAKGGDIAQNLVSMTRLIGEGIDRCRNLARELRPLNSQYDFLTGLEYLRRQMKEMYELDVALDVLSDPRIHSSVLSSLLIRSIRELLFNVVKHSGEKAASVEVRGDGSQVVIAVKDYGRGCDKQALKEKREKNISFGLFDIEERAKFLGGCMRVASEADRGFRVTLTVPRDVACASGSNSLPVDSPILPASSGGHPVSTAPSQTSGVIRVLLADDHDLMRDGLAKLLAEKNLFHVVGAAADGRQAVRLAAELKPDVVLMDFSMPVMNGIDAAMEISRLFPGICIIGLTMHKDPNIKNAMLKAGARDCLSKEVSPEELINSIQAACSDNIHTQPHQMVR